MSRCQEGNWNISVEKSSTHIFMENIINYLLYTVSFGTIISFLEYIYIFKMSSF